MKSQDDLISFARASLGLTRSDKAELIPFSGKVRPVLFPIQVREPLRHPCSIRVRTDQNSYFADIAAFLYECGIPVPKIIRYDEAASRILMEDGRHRPLAPPKWAVEAAAKPVSENTRRRTQAPLHSRIAIPFRSHKVINPFDPSCPGGNGISHGQSRCRAVRH